MRFLGLGKDMVGPLSLQRNGERDGHFSVVVATPGGARAITSVTVMRCDSPPGKCVLAGFASTPYAPGIIPKFFAKGQERVAALGVFRAGKLLRIDARNQDSWLRLPASATGVRLDLYANDGPGCPWVKEQKALACSLLGDHRFAAATRFRVKVTTASPARSYTSDFVTLPGPQQKATAAVQLTNVRYLGLDKDAAGATLGSPPDGKPDAHFRLDLTATSGPGYLSGIGLSRADPGWKGGGWTTAHQYQGSALTVFLDGKQLSLPAPVNDTAHWRTWVDLRWSNTPHHLDLYVYNFGLDWNPPVDEFAPGSPFKIMVLVTVPRTAVTAGEGSAGGATATFTIPAG